MPELLIATNNPGKQREIRAILQDLFILQDLPSRQDREPLKLLTPRELGLQLEVVEDGVTYQENAEKKAAAFAEAAGMICLADDSGLEVDALDGAPGLYSARFSPKPGATDADRCTYLLEKLAGNARPWTARFRCVAALAIPDRDGAVEMQFSKGVCPGEIIPERRGIHGFGYDPIFWMADYGGTMAELPTDLKNEISHRARAVRGMAGALTGLLR